MKAVSYLRVSTDEQGLGIDAQRATVRAYCEREGIELVGEYVDDGVSGAAPLDKRRALIDALAALRRGRAIVAAKRDRIARDPFVAMLVEREADRRGARVLCADGNGNGDDASNVLMRRMLDAFAEFERTQIAMRTRAALHVKRCRGERISGRPPFGYRFLDGKLEGVGDELEILARMAGQRLKGTGPAAIARDLEADGVVNPRTGRARWSRQQVHQVLATSRRQTAS